MSRDLRHYWGIRLAVVGGFLVAFVFVWTAAIRQLGTLTQRTVDCGCSVVPFHWTTGLAIGTALIAAATLYLTIRVLVEILIRFDRHRRLADRLMRRGRHVWHHGARTWVTVADDRDPQALTVGLFRPRIVITTGLIATLSGTEITSVIRHEQAHARARDPLWSLVLESVGATLFWVGGLRQAVNIAFSLREMIADAAATNNYAQTGSLSGAMYKLATANQPRAIPAFSPNADRVTKLLQHSWELPIRWWSWRTVVMVLVVAAGLWFAHDLPAATAAAQPVLPSGACWRREIMCTPPPASFIIMTREAAMSRYGW